MIFSLRTTHLSRLTSSLNEVMVALVGHDGLRQVPEEGLDARGDRLGLPLQPVVQVQLVHLPPVQPHRQKLRHLGGHPHHSVEALLLQSWMETLKNITGWSICSLTLVGLTLI